MSGERHKTGSRAYFQRFGQRARRGTALTADERELAKRLRATCRMPWDSVARSVGRTVAELRAELDPTFTTGE
jgi:hypothetical protein